MGPAEVDSPDFSDTEDHTASSSVSYAATASEAEDSFAIVEDPKIPECLEPAVSKIVTYFLEHPENPSDTVPAGLTLGTPEVAQMSFPTFGDKTIAYRVTVPIQYGPVTVNAYIDTVFAIKGRAGVQMAFQGLDTPFPVDDEQHYTETVVGRLTDT
jgi:hypothetical protein